MFLIAHTFAENANKPEIAYMVSPSFHILSFQSREYIFFVGRASIPRGAGGYILPRMPGRKGRCFFGPLFGIL